MPVHLYKYLLTPGALPEGFRFLAPPPGAEALLEGCWQVPQLRPGWMFSDGSPVILLFMEPETGRPRAFCSAPVLTGREWPAHAGEAVVIRFTPTGFAQCFPGKLPVLRREGLMDVSDIDAALKKPITSSVLETENAASGNDPLAAFADSMMQRIVAIGARHHAPPAKLLQAIGEIRAYNGEISIRELAAGLKVNTKWLERQCMAWVGVSPKEYARLRRFLQAYLHLERTAARDLTATAVHHGFYDRRHLLREFRLFTGTHPKHHLLAETPGNSSNRLPGRWLS